MALRMLAAAGWRTARQAPGHGTWFGSRPVVTQSAGDSGSAPNNGDGGAGAQSLVSNGGHGGTGSTDAEHRAIVLPMPMLSHVMTHGRIIKWHVAEGAPIAIYDVILTVETDTLVEEAYKLGAFAGKVSLLIESQEEGFVARLLAKEGEELPVGKAVAVFCEQAEDVSVVQAGNKFRGDLGNVYQHHGTPPLRLLEWQSYLAEGPPSSGCL